MRSGQKGVVEILLAWACLSVCPSGADELEEAFREPPPEAKPQTWWHWMDGRVSRDGITFELEAMKAIGLGGFQLFNGGTNWQPTAESETPCLSDKWKAMVRHAAAEAQRLGLDFGAQLAGGWSGPGGPWITPDKAMFFVECRQTNLAAGASATVEAPPSWPENGPSYYRDIAVLAFPTPPAMLLPPNPKPALAASLPSPGLTNLNLNLKFNVYSAKPTADTFNHKLENTTNGEVWVSFTFPEPVTCRTVILKSSCMGMETQTQKPLLYAGDDGTGFRFIAQLEGVSCLPNSWYQNVEHAIPPTRAKVFKLVWKAPYVVDLRQAEFSPRPSLTAFHGKTARETFSVASPNVTPEESGVCVAPEKIVDLTGARDAAGRVAWTAPEGQGHWTLLRVGYRNKPMRNAPSPREASGLACDVFDPAVASFHFDQFMGLILNEARACGSRAVKSLLLDSWELESQNWSHAFADEFRKRRGYPVRDFLPAYAGFIVGSRDTTERFLRDARKTGTELVCENFFDVMRRRARENGLTFIAEGFSCGVGTFAADPVEPYLHVDVPMTEAGWSMREASSAAHLTGNPLVACEAHTSRANWNDHPASLRAREDAFFRMGITRVVFHTYAHNADPGRLFPGPAFWSYGTPFSRGQTWWRQGRAWIAYLSRCQALLQRGQFVGDVLAAYGEEMGGPVTGVYGGASGLGGLYAWDPMRDLPEGYDYDLLPAAFLRDALRVFPDGSVGGPRGSRYRLIVLSGHAKSVSPAVARKLKSLVADGAAVLGPRPTTAAGLTEQARADAEVAAIGREVWGVCDGAKVKSASYGKGRVFCGLKPGEVLQALGVAPDFCHTGPHRNSLSHLHRRDGETDIYFVVKWQGALPQKTEMGFRVAGRQPELWDPLTGAIRRADAFRQADGRTWLPAEFGSEHETLFVVFRKPIAVDAQGTAAGNRPVFERSFEVAGPWRVAFNGWGAPSSATFDKLVSWTERPEEAIRYYSGTAIYRTSFEWTNDVPEAAHLALGRVGVTAEVVLNGKPCGVAWTEPYRADVSGALKRGKNEMEIRVANTWANRLIGDQNLPEAQRKTWTSYVGFTADSPLFPSGLIGPVTIRF